MTSFDTLGLGDRLNTILAENGYKTPTPIQAKTIPHLLDGRDLMGLAQTGTGKTAAFGLPLIHTILKQGRKTRSNTARSLILAPTRELAAQITEALTLYAQRTPLKIFMVSGGRSIRPQIERLNRGIDILVATPGRLIDLIDRNAIRLDETQFLVLDEADQMLDLGFVHALRRIAKLLPHGRQTMLFSATMPKQMDEIAASYLHNPIRIEVSPPGKPADKVTQAVHFVGQGDKAAHLRDLLDSHRGERALVFGRTKHGSEKLMKLLVSWGFAAASIHGNKSQGQRDRALAAFKAGEVTVLVATDVAARGIDIPEVGFVYNFDLPNVPENYVHRIGRTARAGAEGAAIALCAPAEMDELKAIEKAIGRKIEVTHGTVWGAAEIAAAPSKKTRGRSQGQAQKPSRPRRRRNKPGRAARRAAAA